MGRFSALVLSVFILGIALGFSCPRIEPLPPGQSQWGSLAVGIAAVLFSAVIMAVGGFKRLALFVYGSLGLAQFELASLPRAEPFSEPWSASQRLWLAIGLTTLAIVIGAGCSLIGLLTSISFNFDTRPRQK